MARPADTAASRRATLGWLAALLVGQRPAAADSAGGAAASARAEFLIDMRQEIAAGRFDPRLHRVGVRGAAPPLSWQRSLLADAAGEPGWFVLRLQFDQPPAQPLAYKFKIDRPGDPDGGWESGPNRSLRVPRQGNIASVERAFDSQTDPPPPERSGRIERIAPRPSRFVSPREVQVWLPPAYAAHGGQRWPVLYLHDGQNVFDSLAAGAEWQVDEVAQRLALAGAIVPPIVVAVASDSDHRIDEYTPYTQTRGSGTPAGGGQAADYARYLVEELKPFVDRHWRTRPDRAQTAVGGSSLGGLLSMWLLLEHAGTFGAGLVVSPSVWWGGGAIVEQARLARLPPGAVPPRVWLCVGGREGQAMVEGVRLLRQTLLQRGWAPGGLEQAGAGHDEASWAARVEPMLRFLYGAG